MRRSSALRLLLRDSAARKRTVIPENLNGTVRVIGQNRVPCGVEILDSFQHDIRGDKSIADTAGDQTFDTFIEADKDAVSGETVKRAEKIGERTLVRIKYDEQFGIKEPGVQN